MDRPMHDLRSLFAQLGEPNDESSINRFIEKHRPLASDMRLYEAPFWTASQAGFLRDAILEDADWAEVVDELNAKLHEK